MAIERHLMHCGVQTCTRTMACMCPCARCEKATLVIEERCPECGSYSDRKGICSSCLRQQQDEDQAAMDGEGYP